MKNGWNERGQKWKNMRNNKWNWWMVNGRKEFSKKNKHFS
jgi:hypothetical protein